MLALTLVHTVLHRHDGGDDPARQLQEEEEEGGKKKLLSTGRAEINRSLLIVGRPLRRALLTSISSLTNDRFDSI